MAKFEQLFADVVNAKGQLSWTSRQEAIELWPLEAAPSFVEIDYAKLEQQMAATYATIGLRHWNNCHNRLLNQLEYYVPQLAWFHFKCIENSPTCIVFKNSWYTIQLIGDRFKVYKHGKAKEAKRFDRASQTIDWLMRQVDYGTHYVYVAGVAITPLQRFSSIKENEDYTELADILQQANAQLAFHNSSVFRWVSKHGEIEITNSKFKTTMALGKAATTEEEESNMNIFDLIAGEALFEVKVQFDSTPGREYSYKSEVAYEPGATVVVETPTTGLTVVTVVSSSKGLSGGDFPKYKWIVGALDTKRYKELLANEQNAIAKLAAVKRAVKRAAAAKQELEALGLSATDVLTMLGLASKAE